MIFDNPVFDALPDANQPLLPAQGVLLFYQVMQNPGGNLSIIREFSSIPADLTACEEIRISVSVFLLILFPIYLRSFVLFVGPCLSLWRISTKRGSSFLQFPIWAS
jgi:hypothetical protein